MPRGRKPAGDRLLTGAERQARYRAIHAGQPVGRPAIVAGSRAGRLVVDQRHDLHARPERQL